MRAGLPLVSLVLASLAAAHLDSPSSAKRHAALNRAVDDEWAPEDDVLDLESPLFADHPVEDEDDVTEPVDVHALETRGVKKTKAGLAWTNEVAKGLKSFSNQGVFGSVPLPLTPLCFPC